MSNLNRSHALAQLVEQIMHDFGAGGEATSLPGRAGCHHIMFELAQSVRLARVKVLASDLQRELGTDWLVLEPSPNDRAVEFVFSSKRPAQSLR